MSRALLRVMKGERLIDEMHPASANVVPRIIGGRTGLATVVSPKAPNVSTSGPLRGGARQRTVLQFDYT